MDLQCPLQIPLAKTPQDYDVIFGRLGGIPINPGTQAYRDLVKRMSLKYRHCIEENKKNMARNIITELKDKHGANFWKVRQSSRYVDGEVLWKRPKGKALNCFLLDEKQLIRAVHQSLRDYSAPRKCHFQPASGDDFIAIQDIEVTCPTSSSNLEPTDSTIVIKVDPVYDSYVSSPWCCLQLHVTAGSSCIPSAYVELKFQNNELKKNFVSGSDGLNALFKAINGITNFPVEFLRYESSGTILENEIWITARNKKEGHIYTGTATSSDIFIGAAEAYLDAVNKVFNNQDEFEYSQPVDTPKTDTFFMDVAGNGIVSVYETDSSFDEEKWIVDCTQVTLHDLSSCKSTGFVRLRNSSFGKEAICTGDGAIHALIKAINKIILKDVTIVQYSSTLSSTKGCKDKDCFSEEEIEVETKIVISVLNGDDKRYFGKAIAKDIIISFAEAYISSINKLRYAELQEETDKGAKLARQKDLSKEPVTERHKTIPRYIVYQEVKDSNTGELKKVINPVENINEIVPDFENKIVNSLVKGYPVSPGLKMGSKTCL